MSLDLRALEAADSITDDQMVRAGMGSSAQGFYRSLHLNLARPTGNWDSSAMPETTSNVDVPRPTRGDDEYCRMSKNGLDQLASRLAVG